jgi:signal transduction histidine kinase
MRTPRNDALPSAQDACARVARLEQRLRELDAFTTAVAYELRSSLCSVGGFARAIELDDTRLGPKTRSRLRRIAQAASQMERVIDDAMAFTRGDRFEVGKVDLQLDEMVRHLLREMRADYPATRVTLSELPIIHADPVVVRHVLGNVLANAFKFSVLAPEPAVEISLDASGALQVIDNGLGFANEDAAKIFEPFVRLTRDPAYLGAGLGLATVKQWLDRHGGWIRAESREGGPTRFTLSFED